MKGESFITYTQEYDSIGVRKVHKINRSFDVYEGHPFFVAISNDGRKIIYLTNYLYESRSRKIKTLHIMLMENWIKLSQQKNLSIVIKIKKNVNFFTTTNIKFMKVVVLQ